MSKLLRCIFTGLLLYSATASAGTPSVECEEILFDGVDLAANKVLSVCKKGEYIDFFYGKRENEADAIHFDTPIEQTGWGEDINRSGDTHTVMTLLNGIEQYGVYIDKYEGKKKGGIIFYNCEGEITTVNLDTASLNSKLGPYLSEIGVSITNDF